MTPQVAVATDLDTLALVLRIQPDDPDDTVLEAVSQSAAQHPSAVVLDLAAGGRRGPKLLRALTQRAAQYAVPLLIVPLLAAGAPPARSYASVPEALDALSHTASPPEHRRLSRLPPAITTPAIARALAGDALRLWDRHHLLLAAELVVSELVSNAVTHAATSVDLLLRRTDVGVQIGVRDGSPHPPRMAGHDPSDVEQSRGRGLFLVSVTAARWGFLLGTADKVVWATIEK